MEIIQGLEDAKPLLQRAAITVGNFDGVHRGHQALFDRVKAWARKLDARSVVMTFNPHPLEVLAPEKQPPLITPHDRKLELIESCGIDTTVVVPFSREFAGIAAREFVRGVLVEKLGTKAIVVGYDYHFGKGREGDTHLLRELGLEFGFQVESVSGVQQNGNVVSSTLIRRMIQEGNLRKAGDFLGRWYELRGPVEHGRARGGRLLGFPTANVRFGKQARPKPGVYAVQVTVDGVVYGGAANLGWNPTFGDSELSLEVHILDFDREIYGKPMRVRFLERIRDEKKFESIDALVAQIREDVEHCRALLSGAIFPDERFNIV